MKNLLILLSLLICTIGYSQKLKIIDQDFEKAREIANQENKLLFIDFYTTWCAPCKKMDKWIFQNDTLSQHLANDFVLLRYDAEKDKKFNLSKKHHVNSYPTGIILNSNGYILNRKYGFPGEDVKELSESVFGFADESIELNKQNRFQKGYSNNVEISKYPEFYIDFVNRDDTKVEASQEFKNYWKIERDELSEEYFSTLVYFADKIPSSNMDSFLENKESYVDKYGEQDVDIALFHMIRGRFKVAINEKSESKFKMANEFMKKIITEDELNMFIPFFEKQFKEATNE